MTIQLKQAGVWTDPFREAYFKDSGAWQEASAVYIKENGAWGLVFQKVYEFALASAEDLNLQSYLESEGVPSGAVVEITVPEGETIGGTVNGGYALNPGALDAYQRVSLIVSGDVIGKGGASGSKHGSHAIGGTAADNLTINVTETGRVLAGGGAGGNGGQGGYGEHTRNTTRYDNHGLGYWKEDRIRNSPQIYWATSGSSNSYWTGWSDDGNQSLGKHAGYEWLLCFRDGNGGGNNGATGGFAGAIYEWTVFRRDNFYNTDVTDGKAYILGTYIKGSGNGGSGGVGGDGAGYNNLTANTGTNGSVGPYQAGTGGAGGSGGDFGTDGEMGALGGSGKQWAIAGTASGQSGERWTSGSSTVYKGYRVNSAGVMGASGGNAGIAIDCVGATVNDNGTISGDVVV